MLDQKKKNGRYNRVYTQLADLLDSGENTIAAMSTIASVLHHKFEDFFWTGFYLLNDEDLIVGPYQGPVACINLEKNKGVCWAGINSGKPVIVPNVHEFPGHIACDSRSNSEIVIPVKDQNGKIRAVLDIDSKKYSNFDEEDARGLERIVDLIYAKVKK